MKMIQTRREHVYSTVTVLRAQSTGYRKSKEFPEKTEKKEVCWGWEWG